MYHGVTYTKDVQVYCAKYLKNDIPHKNRLRRTILRHSVYDRPLDRKSLFCAYIL